MHMLPQGGGVDVRGVTLAHMLVHVSINAVTGAVAAFTSWLAELISSGRLIHNDAHATAPHQSHA